MRHETGHAIQHGYQLHRRRKWQELFGKSSTTYPEYYRPNPASKRYVQHLRLWYAQSHPDEDFAETFAVWLRPRSDWRSRYAGWPALRKLRYVDYADERDLRQEAARRDATRDRAALEADAKRSREHYESRREKYTVKFPNTYDADLRASSPTSRATGVRRRPRASFVGTRREIRRLVAKWTGEFQYTLELVLDDMIGRCRELRLARRGSRTTTVMDFCRVADCKDDALSLQPGEKRLDRAMSWSPGLRTASR